MDDKNISSKPHEKDKKKENNDNVYSLLLPIIGGNKNKKDIDDALNNITNKNDIEQICYFLINKKVPSSTGYLVFFFMFLS